MALSDLNTSPKQNPENGAPESSDLTRGQSTIEMEMVTEEKTDPVEDAGAPMSQSSLKALIEGLLFISGEDGLSLIQIQSAIPECSRQEISSTLDLLQQEYQKREHGFELARFGQRYKFVSKESVYERAKKLYEDIIIPTLSSAALETLAIIAYRQPVTRVEIEQIRGVSSEAMLKKLQARSLIETDGRLDAVGKPLLYRVTEHFLDIFGIESLADLPEMKTGEARGELFGKPDFDLPDSQEADGALRD